MKMIIAGKQVDASNGAVIQNYNPYNGVLLGEVPSATREDVERALDYAYENRHVWADTPLFERARVLLKYADLLEQHKMEIAEISTLECGKPLAQSVIEVEFVVKLVRFYVEKANHLYGNVMPQGVQQGYEKDIIYTVREALGVIACIVPFNFPIELYGQKIAPALAAGNSIIIKPASDTPMAAIKMTELMFEAGLPKEAAQIITGSGSTVGTWLSSSPKIAAVSFTGSTEVGIDVYRNAAANLAQASLELGGNDPLIICDDADMELAITESVNGRTYTNGQVCSASKRFIVQNTIKEEYTKRLVEKLKEIKVGDPMDPNMDMGPLINEKAAIQVEKDVQHTLDQGAKLALGSQRDGAMLGPIVLTDVTPEMDIALDLEVFGPVFPIIGFDTLDEAIEIANASKYGLSSGFMSQDMNKVFYAAGKMKDGGVIINGSGAYRTADMPYGGYKHSGIGREGVSVSLEEYTQKKNIVIKGVLK